MEWVLLKVVLRRDVKVHSRLNLGQIEIKLNKMHFPVKRSTVLLKKKEKIRWLVLFSKKKNYINTMWKDGIKN